MAFLVVRNRPNLHALFVRSKSTKKRKIPQLLLRHSNRSDDKFLYSFKIVQIADIHLGEAEDQVWGPEQDHKTWIVLENVLTTEKPDLIVLSGDQLTGNDCDANATAYYQLLGQKLTAYGTPWAMIFGNHDDSPFEGLDPLSGEVVRLVPAKTNRSQLVQSHREFDLSMTEEGPPDVFGVSNYWLDLYAPENAAEMKAVAARLLLLDSGGGSLEQRIDQSQVNWFWQTNTANHLPVFAFQHIPASFKDFHFVDGRCVGQNGENGLAPIQYDAGIVQTLKDAGNVHWLAVGHNHGDDYCCRLPRDSNSTHSNDAARLHVCFGRHSGYGGYGRWDRGARTYQIYFDKDASLLEWRSWVRLESGEIIDRYNHTVGYNAE